ncbi:unnamed protein product [Arabidopsis halleri]
MGNLISLIFCCGRRRMSNTPPTMGTAPLELPANRFVFAAAPPYLNPNPNYFDQYPGYCLPPPQPQPYSLHHLHQYPPHSYQLPHPLIPGGRSPILPSPYVHQKAVTIRNDVNLKKESLRLIPDSENPNRLLVSFTFDATLPGRITVVFFATEDEECNLRATKEDTLPPITFDFGKGLGQKFIQPSGTGIDLTAFADSELFKEVDTDVFPLAVKAEATPAEEGKSGSANVQITQVVYTKEKGEIKIEVVKQILWVNKMRYELREIYGIENTVDGCNEGKECVVCLSEPRDIAVLPCRHMCMCSGCAKALRFQTNLCPICRQPVERLLEIMVDGNKNGGTGDGDKQI